jgi:hypothetical protein
MMKSNLIRSAAILAAAGACVAGAPAIACDQHDEAAYAFLATLELGGMSEEEVMLARSEAIRKYHAKELERAKSAFVRRFNVDPAPAGDTRLASAAEG